MKRSTLLIAVLLALPCGMAMAQTKTAQVLAAYESLMELRPARTKARTP